MRALLALLEGELDRKAIDRPAAGDRGRYAADLRRLDKARRLLDYRPQDRGGRRRARLCGMVRPPARELIAVPAGPPTSWYFRRGLIEAGRNRYFSPISCCTLGSIDVGPDLVALAGSGAESRA